ncbi:MAG: hypothetical protein KY394_00620 [Actinobacteria bacterium]|nr:hypothetical protein [Actinomycetota bacterium]
MPLDPAIWPHPVPIAHRGSRLLWPENTMEASANSIAMGVRHLETDLHMTSDGVLVCHHDPTVDRTTVGEGRVEEMTFTELRALDAGTWSGSSSSGSPASSVTAPTSSRRP